MAKRWYPAAFTALAIGCGGATGEDEVSSGGSQSTGGMGYIYVTNTGGGLAIVYGVLSGGNISTGGKGTGGMGTVATGGSIDAGAPTGGKSTTLVGFGGAVYGVMGGSNAFGGYPSTTGTRTMSGGALPVGGTVSAGGATVSGGTHTTAGGIDAGFPTGGAAALGGQWSVDYGASFYGGGSSIDIPDPVDAGVDHADGG